MEIKAIYLMFKNSTVIYSVVKQKSGKKGIRICQYFPIRHKDVDFWFKAFSKSEVGFPSWYSTQSSKVPGERVVCKGSMIC